MMTWMRGLSWTAEGWLRMCCLSLRVCRCIVDMSNTDHGFRTHLLGNSVEGQLPNRRPDTRCRKEWQQISIAGKVSLVGRIPPSLLSSACTAISLQLDTRPSKMDSETPIMPGQPAAPRPDHNAVAAAIERRLQAEREHAAAAPAAATTSQSTNFDASHEKRQEFRRMIDPGILRPNPRNVALESLQVRLSSSPCQSTRKRIPLNMPRDSPDAA